MTAPIDKQRPGTIPVEEFLAQHPVSRDLAWMLRRTSRGAPHLADEVLADKITITQAYSRTVLLERTRKTELERARAMRTKVVKGAPLRVIRSRPLQDSIADLEAGTKALRRMCDDRYSAETLRREFTPERALQIEADLSIVRRFVTLILNTWERPALRALNEKTAEPNHEGATS